MLYISEYMHRPIRTSKHFRIDSGSCIQKWLMDMKKKPRLSALFPFFGKGAAHRGLIRRDLCAGSVLMRVGPSEKRCYITVFHQKAHLSGKKSQIFLHSWRSFWRRSLYNSCKRRFWRKKCPETGPPLMIKRPARIHPNTFLPRISPSQREFRTIRWSCYSA